MFFFQLLDVLAFWASELFCPGYISFWY